MFNINKILVEWIKNLIWIYKFCFIVFFYCFFSVHDLLPARLGWPGGARVDLEGPVLTWRDSGWSGGPGLTWRDQGWPGGTRVDMEGPGLTWRNQGWPGGTSIDLEGLRLTWRDQGWPEWRAVKRVSCCLYVVSISFSEIQNVLVLYVYNVRSLVDVDSQSRLGGT